MSQTREALEIAYRATAYTVDGPKGLFVIRTGQPSPEADALMDTHQVQTWAYITAFNPGSQLQIPQINNQRHQVLVDAVKDRFTFLQGESRSDTGDWPAER